MLVGDRLPHAPAEAGVPGPGPAGVVGLLHLLGGGSRPIHWPGHPHVARRLLPGPAGPAAALSDEQEAHHCLRGLSEGPRVRPRVALHRVRHQVLPGFRRRGNPREGVQLRGVPVAERRSRLAARGVRPGPRGTGKWDRDDRLRVGPGWRGRARVRGWDRGGLGAGEIGQIPVLLEPQQLST